MGIVLREFTFGHVRQLGAVLRRLLVATGRAGVVDGINERAFIDIDSLLRPVYGRDKQSGHRPEAAKDGGKRSEPSCQT